MNMRGGARPVAVLVAVAACLAWASIAGAAAAPAAASPTVMPKFGGELRLRGEAFNNVLDLSDRYDDAYQYWRMRYRFWADATPREGLRLYLRFGNEYRMGVYSGLASVRDAESRTSLDNGWAELSDAKRGLALRFGRMDLMLGEGFLVFDGTPADGSSSLYFDAIRGTWKRGDLAVDLFTAKLTDEGFGTPARDEDLNGVYAKRRELEAYVLYRFKRGATVFQDGKPWAVPSPRQRTTALGARWAHLPDGGWRAAAEGAYQIGRFEDDLAAAGSDAANARRGYGGYARAGWAADCCSRQGFEVGGLYLSGDDPGTARYEGWDDFYGEWPKWSELLIYTFLDCTTRVGGGGARPDDAGAWNNLTAYWAEVHADLAPQLTVTLRGTVLGAPEATGPGGGHDRGTLLSLRADCTRWRGVALQALGELFDPGDYYSGRGGYSDRAWYSRAQIVTSF
ncbi:MAG: alginate export family protein [Candidatus Krumholzibacteriia bacterium]